MVTSLGVMQTYRKTDKGHDEIATRAFRLAPRLRTPLIMVDGRRSEEELRKLIATQFDESVETLLDQGFIEIIDAVPSRVARATPGNGSAATPGSADAAEESLATAAADSSVPFEDLRRSAVRSLIDQMGPPAEGLAMKMEKARNAQELRPLLDSARDILSTGNSQQAAAEFSVRFITPLRA